MLQQTQFSLHKSSNRLRLLQCISKLEGISINDISSNGYEYTYKLKGEIHTVPFEFLNSMANINHLDISVL